MFTTHAWTLRCSRCKASLEMKLAGSSFRPPAGELPLKDLGASALQAAARPLGWVGGDTLKPLCGACR